MSAVDHASPSSVQTYQPVDSCAFGRCLVCLRPVHLPSKSASVNMSSNRRLHLLQGLAALRRHPRHPPVERSTGRECSGLTFRRPRLSHVFGHSSGVRALTQGHSGFRIGATHRFHHSVNPRSVLQVSGRESVSHASFDYNECRSRHVRRTRSLLIGFEQWTV